MPEGRYKAVAAVATALWAVTHRKQNCKNGSPAFAGLRRDRQSRGYRAAFTLPKQRGPESVRGFTLAELLVSVFVLVLLVFLFTQLLTSATTVTLLGIKLMDADSQARQVFDRMAVDFAQMVKRTDVDYYMKFTGGPLGQLNQNDQIAFYSNVPGYYPSSGAQSPLSLVAYRVNSNATSPSYNKLERLGKGLVWNGVSTTDTPAVFLPLLISNTWPYATNQNSDPAYEVIGPQVFRFEYYFLQTSGALIESPCSVSPCPSLNAWQGISAIVVDLAVIDPRSKVLFTDQDIASLNGNNTNNYSRFLPDFHSDMNRPGILISKYWQGTLNGITTLPSGVSRRQTIPGIRVYERYFYLPH